MLCHIVTIAIPYTAHITRVSILWCQHSTRVRTRVYSSRSTVAISNNLPIPTRYWDASAKPKPTKISCNNELTCWARSARRRARTTRQLQFLCACHLVSPQGFWLLVDFSVKHPAGVHGYTSLLTNVEGLVGRACTRVRYGSQGLLKTLTTITTGNK